MSLPNLNLVNQFGEESINYVLASSNLPGAEPIAATSVVANLTAGSALPVAVTLQALANKEPAKAGVASITAIGVLTPAVDQTTTNTNIATIQAKVDAILAALKVIS